MTANQPTSTAAIAQPSLFAGIALGFAWIAAFAVNLISSTDSVGT